MLARSNGSCTRPHRSRIALALVASVILLCTARDAEAGKDHCRDISFDGVAGVGSQDVVSFTILGCDASTVHESCAIQVQASEDSVDFLKRLPGSWGEPDFASCPTPDPNDLPKKACVNSNNGSTCNPSTGEGCHSCKLKLKLKQKSDGTYKKKHVQVCCYENADCKKKLGKIDAAPIPVTTQAEKNFSEVCPPDEEACAEAPSECVVNLDPMGIRQFPGEAAKKCRSVIGREVSIFANAVVSEMTRCHEERLKGDLPPSTDCNDPATDAGNGIGNGEQRLQAKLASCAEVGSPWRLGYRSCHAPCDTINILVCTAGSNIGSACTTDRDCDTAAGARDGACGDWSQVEACLACETKAAVAQAVADEYGTPATAMSQAGIDCQRGIGKAFADLAKAQLVETAACQKKRDSAKVVLPATVGNCKDADLRGKRVKAEQRARSTVGKFCSLSDLAELDSICSGAATLTQVEDCVIANASLVNDASSAIAFPETRSKPPGGCPGTAVLKFTTSAGKACNRDTDCIPGVCVNNVCRTPTDIDLGASGLGHDQDIPDKSRLGLTLSCSATQAPCGSCNITGLDTSGDNCRCSNDSTITCSQPLQPDPNCGGNICQCYVNEPTPISGIGSQPLCMLQSLRSAPTGSIDADFGATALRLETATQLFLGTSVAEPCPVCNGDTTPRDGVPDGTCSAGPRAGLPCDATAIDHTFGALSLDCLPDPLTDTSGGGLRLDLDLSTGSVTLPASQPCLTPSLACHCGLCSGDPAIACASNADCAGAGAGTCASAMQAPNGCSALSCSASSGGEDLCLSGPMDFFCDGFLRTDGQGIVSCNVNGDCAAGGSGCPGGDCGSCTLAEPRKCFADPITAAGIETPGNPLLVSAFCMPPLQSGALNAVLGLPGPGRAVLQATPRLLCAADPSVAYAPEIGGCP